MANPRIYRDVAEKRRILRDIYGGMMKLDDIMKEFGYKTPYSARRAVQEMGILPIKIGRMTKYETDMVAKWLVETRGMC